MSKYNLLWNEEKMKRYIKEGRGQGTGKEYKPWITIRDFPSKGLSSRQPGWKSSRVCHFMSTNELRMFFLLEWSDLVTDIREQYPLDASETLKIAEELGINHPMDRKTNFPYVMTTDFMITIHTNGTEKNIARTVKPASDLELKNCLEHYQIEKIYWQRKNVDWGIVADRDIPRTLTANIEWVYSTYCLEPLDDLGVDELRVLAESLKERLKSKAGSIANVTNEFDREMNLKHGTGLYIFKHLVARKEIVLDMESAICATASVDIIRKIINKNDRMIAL